MMQADWIKPAQSDPYDPGRDRGPLRVLAPAPAQNENRPGKPAPRQPVWPILVLALGLAASLAWALLLAWLVFRW